MQCHACAARDAEHRRAADEISQRRRAAERGGYRFNDDSFDGLYVAIRERGE